MIMDPYATVVLQYVVWQIYLADIYWLKEQILEQRVLGLGIRMNQKENLIIDLPLIDWRLGRIVIAPSAISSWCSTGEILEPQLSDPTQIKRPV